MRLISVVVVLAWVCSGGETVRERLVKAEEELKQMPARAGLWRSPRLSDLTRYLQLQPWLAHAAGQFPGEEFGRYIKQLPPAWPGVEDAAALRALLADSDACVRALALSALGSLKQIEDIPRMAALLGDHAESMEFLSGVNSVPQSIEGGVADPCVLERCWQKCTVAERAGSALYGMTGEIFAAENFDDWWKKHQPAEEQCWYWRERMRRRLGAIERDMVKELESVLTLDLSEKEWRAREQSVRGKWALVEAAGRRSIMLELRKFSPEIEAKMRVMYVDDEAHSETLYEGELALRIGEEGLLEQLEAKKRWAEAEKDGHISEKLWKHLLSAKSPVMQARNIPRLKASMDGNPGGRQALAIAVSRLLPPATAERLNDPGTRDGWLRQTLMNEKDAWTKNALMEDLIRVSLPLNRAFVERLFFAETARADGGDDLRHAVLRALGKPPLTAEQRALLCDLVLDERFKECWTRRNERMGMDMHRKYAIWSLNAHAGRELINPSSREEYDLTDPGKSEKALEGVLKKVRGLRDMK